MAKWHEDEGYSEAQVLEAALRKFAADMAAEAESEGLDPERTLEACREMLGQGLIEAVIDEGGVRIKLTNRGRAHHSARRN